MKKTFVLPTLIAATLFASCNGDGKSSNGSTDTTTSTTNTTTVSADTGMNNNSAANNNNNTAAAGTSYSSTPLEGADKEFAMKAAMGGMAEVQSGQVAQQNAMNDRVKAFGSMMVNDHSAANQELMSLAKAKGLMLPDSLDKMHKDHIMAMQKMTGKDFDKHYIGMMVTDHNKDVAEFEKAAQSSKDADLKAWATKTLPTLKMHQDSAKAINMAIK